MSAAFWDWYEGTLHGASAEDVCSAIARGFGWRAVGPSPVDQEPCRALHGYQRGMRLSADGERLVDIWWGGNAGVHVVASGEPAKRLAEVVRNAARSRRWEWLPSRVDSAVDWIEEGLYDRLVRICTRFAIENRITIDQRGDWERGQARTLYLGAPSSVVRLCLYEKGYESDADRNWVRWEVRVRPKGERRRAVALWGPATAQGASAWLCDLRRQLRWDELEEQSVGTVWRPSDAERARRALVAQYGRTLRAWCDEVGSWEAVGSELGSRVEAEAPPIQTSTCEVVSTGVHLGAVRTPIGVAHDADE